MWQSADPILGTYLNGKRGRGGVYSPKNLGMYSYAHLNPIRYNDPDGESVFSIMDWYDFTHDVGGLLVDEIVYTAAVMMGDDAVANLALEGMVEKRFDAAASTIGIASPAPRTGEAIKAAAKIEKVIKSTEKLADRTEAASRVAKKTEKVGSLPKPPTGKGSVPPSERDPKRVWTKKENTKKYEEQRKKCVQCGEEKSLDEMRGHHKERHADGEKTDDANHVVVCDPCHKELHSGGE